MPEDPRRPLRAGDTVVTVFEVRVTGDMPGGMRTTLTNAFLRGVTRIANLPAIVIGHQEVFGPEEETTCPTPSESMDPP